MRHLLPALSLARCAQSVSMLALVATLAGCASTWVVDSDVNTFSKLGSVPVGAGYRFERLPSQQMAEPQQSQLEAMADAALQQVGLRRDDARPAYSAQIDAHVTATIAPWDDPWFSPGWGPRYPFGYGPGYRAGFGGAYGGGFGGGYGRGWHGRGWGGWGGGFYGPVFPPNPWYQREVSVVLRELPSNQIVYETSARSDGPYPNSGAVLPIMFDAALQGFPHPPAGVRQVRINVLPAPPPASAPAPAKP